MLTGEESAGADLVTSVSLARCSKFMPANNLQAANCVQLVERAALSQGYAEDASLLAAVDMPAATSRGCCCSAKPGRHGSANAIRYLFAVPLAVEANPNPNA